MSRDALRTLLIVVLLVAAGSALLLHYYERVEREVDFGYSPAARSNDYLAATRFLNAMGIPATELPTPLSPSSLPEEHEVLLITSKRLTLNPDSQRALLDWVRGGGYLIISARTQTVSDGLGDLFERFNEVNSGDDTLFDQLGIELVEAEDAEYAPMDLWFGDMEDPIQVRFDRDWRLSAGDGPMLPLAEDDAGVVLLGGTIGDGHVSVIVDRKVLHNRRIGDHDNALLLWHLVNLYGPAGAVHMVSDDNMPALPVWLWGHARELMISLMITLVLVLYAASRRFGPLRQLAPPRRRSLAEHLRAAGAFQWRYHYPGRLLQAVQDDVRREMSRKHPFTAQLDPTRAAAHLAELVSMPEADIFRALSHYSDAAGRRMKPENYTETVRLLTELRKQL